MPSPIIRMMLSAEAERSVKNERIVTTDMVEKRAKEGRTSLIGGHPGGMQSRPTAKPLWSAGIKKPIGKRERGKHRHGRARTNIDEHGFAFPEASARQTGEDGSDEERFGRIAAGPGLRCAKRNLIIVFQC
jgi:hypothetical protein